jgi:hypothetical protein
MTTTNKQVIRQSIPSLPKLLPGLNGLESHVEPDVFIYIVRLVYGMIFKSKQLGENKQQLQRRIERFERQSDLPGFMSSVPINQLLERKPLKIPPTNPRN